MSRISKRAFANAASAALFLAAASWTHAASLVIESPEHRVALLELYTSEGCSSCPPADRWISSLRDEPDLWRGFIPLSFHVDYWDYIGWPDRFATPAYTERQYRHASQQAMRTVYTPGFFLNGEEWRWRGRSLGADIENTPAGVLRVEVDSGGLSLRFDGIRPHRGLRASVALLGFGLQTRVKAGENAGRTLNHDFVVLSLEEVRLEVDGDSFTAALPAPAVDVDAERYAIAAWISEDDNPTPIQAAGGWWKRL